MDENHLAAKGISPRRSEVGHVDGFALRIGERATLVVSEGGCAYGVLMEISADEAKRLYSDPGVVDYVAETLTVELVDGTQAEASCYLLPENKIVGANKDYAKALCALAIRLGLPERYVSEIRRLGE